MPKDGKIIVLVDTKEKKPFIFPKNGFTIQRQNLPIGDYTIKGMERVVIIERKNSFLELERNIRNAANRERFLSEIASLTQFPRRLILVEDDLASHVYEDSRSYKEVDFPFLMRWITVITQLVPILPIGRRSSRTKHILAHIFTKLAQDRSFLPKTLMTAFQTKPRDQDFGLTHRGRRRHIRLMKRPHKL